MPYDVDICIIHTAVVMQMFQQVGQFCPNEKNIARCLFVRPLGPCAPVNNDNVEIALKFNKRKSMIECEDASVWKALKTNKKSYVYFLTLTNSSSLAYVTQSAWPLSRKPWTITLVFFVAFTNPVKAARSEARGVPWKMNGGKNENTKCYTVPYSSIVTLFLDINCMYLFVYMFNIIRILLKLSN